MLAGGISIQRLLQPFLFAGLAATVLMYLNNEFILPAAAQERKFMDDMRASHKNQHGHGAQHLILADQSTMIYQHYDTAREQFVDVYWIRSANEVYRMAAMKPYTDPPVGIHVDHIVRDSSHTRSLQASYPEKNFPEISFHKQSLTESVIPPEGMSLTQLWYKLPTDEEVRSDKDARIEATFHRKLASPWLCLLAVIGPAPWCMRFSRQFPVAAVYAAGMFGMVAIYIVLDSAHVLARRQLLDPMWAIWTPLVALTALFGYVYNRTR
jgi:lipopolysaccharide export system permease protein